MQCKPFCTSVINWFRMKLNKGLSRGGHHGMCPCENVIKRSYRRIPIILLHLYTVTTWDQWESQTSEKVRGNLERASSLCSSKTCHRYQALAEGERVKQPIDPPAKNVSDGSDFCRRTSSGQPASQAVCSFWSRLQLPTGHRDTAVLQKTSPVPPCQHFSNTPLSPGLSSAERSCLWGVPSSL